MTEPVDLLRQFNLDRALAASVLFAHRHSDESPPAHVEIMDLWNSAYDRVLIEAARGFGKSTHAEEAILLGGVFGNFHYWLLIGETYKKACQRLGSIDLEARTNQKLRDLFGGSVLARNSIENKIWFKSGAMLECMGWEQELQSLKEGQYRPEGAWLDDIEDKERVRDKAAVDESMRKLYLELLPALDVNACRIRFTQARRAEDCMVTRLARDPQWVYRAYPVCTGDPDDPETVSNWPQRYPMEWVRKEKASYQAAGMLSEFLQSYMLQAVNLAAKPFQVEMLGAMEVSPYHWMPRYAIYDPSRGNRRERKGNEAKSDRTGKVVVSRLGSKILVHESSGNYWQPSELIEDLFSTMARHHPAKIGIEQNSLNQWLSQPIRLEMIRRATVLPLSLMQAPQDRSKEDFILGLQPFAQARDIVLIGGLAAHPDLVQEWANFPAGSRDVINALAYSLRMFGGVPMYEDFTPANIADAPSPRRGEEVFVAVNAGMNELVAAACIKDGRRLCIAKDWSYSGPLGDTVKTFAFDLRTSYPQADLQLWVPADVFDQWQRVGLLPALRTEKFSPMRGEYVSVARGCLAERMRSVWHQQRQLTVDRNAREVLNALAAGYCLPTDRGGRTAAEPEAGPARMLAEALECMVSRLDKSEASQSGFPKGAHIDHTPGGAAYISSNPRTKVAI